MSDLKSLYEELERLEREDLSFKERKVKDNIRRLFNEIELAREKINELNEELVEIHRNMNFTFPTGEYYPFSELSLVCVFNTDKGLGLSEERELFDAYHIRHPDIPYDVAIKKNSTFQKFGILLSSCSLGIVRTEIFEKRFKEVLTEFRETRSLSLETREVVWI